MTDIASENQSFFNSIIGNTTERTTTKLITFYKTHSHLGLLISKAQVGSYIAIANNSSSLIPKPDSKFPSSKSNCTDLNKWHVISVTWAIAKDLSINKTNDLILNLTPENVTQHSRIVTTTCKGSSTPTKMSKIIGRQIH